MSLFEKTRLYPWSRYRLWEIMYNVHYTTGKDSRGKNLDHKEAVIMILQSLSSTSSLSLRNLNIPQKYLVNLIQPDVNTDVFLEMSPPTEDLVTIVARKGLFFHSKSPDITFEWFERLFFVYIESLGITFPGNSEVTQPQVPLKMRFFGKTISAEVALEGRHFAWMTIF